MDRDKAIRAAKLTANQVNSHKAADQVADLLRQGRASEVTNDLMEQADPQRLHHHYTTGNTGMDMPMDYASRMARAGQMGFNTGNKLYHGSVRDFNSFIPSQSGKVGPGVYMTPNERKAGIFSGYEYDNNPRIEKLLNEGNEKSSQVYGLLATNRPATMEARQAVRTNESAYDDRAEHYRKKFDEMGFDGVSVADERTILDPTNIRSQFARFDPRLAHLSHLSASTGGAMELARHATAVGRAGGQVAPSKYMPNVPRAVHADGGPVLPKGYSLKVDREKMGVLAHYNGQPVGQLTLMRDRDSGDLTAFQMAVHPKHQRKGLMSAMHDAAEDAFGPMQPDKTLTDDGFAFWKGYRPDAVSNNLRFHADKLMGQTMQTRYGPGTVKSVGSNGMNTDLTDPERVGSTGWASVKDNEDAIRGLGIDPSTLKYADGGEVESKRDFVRDNPGGEWLEGKKARAAQYPDDKFMVGATTGVIGGRSSMFLPTHILKGIAGLNDEVRTSGVHKYDSLLSDAREGGFDPDQKGNKVVVAVNHYGQPYLLEGNTRVAVAHSMGIPKVKAEVRYWNGAENVDGPMHPEKVFGMASDNPEIAKSDGGEVDGGFEVGKKYNGVIPQIKYLPVHAIERQPSQYEVSRVSDDVAKNMDFSEPVEATAFRYGSNNSEDHPSVALQNGHHRLAAAHQTGRPHLPVTITAVNAKGEKLNALKALSDEIERTMVTKADGGRVSYGNGGKSLGLYSKAAQIIRNQPQAKGSVDQLLAMVSKTKGVKPAELTNAGRPAGDTMSKEELAKHFDDALPKVDVERIGGRDSNGFPQYEEYTLPGGENYREHLLHLSDEREPPKALHRVMGAFPRDFDSEEGARQYIRQLDTMRNTPGMEGIAESLTRYPAIYQRENGRSTNPNDFKSSHWDTPNVLAHVRMSDRDNGETLHVHEVQSDWGQEGRENGFHDPEKPFEVVNKKTKEVVSRHPDYSSMWDAYRTHPDSDNLTYGDVRDEKPPQGPYVGNTQQWTDLALKHIMMEAAKGGYKRVVFSPGEANADLYGQRKEVSKLEFLKSNDSGEAGILSGFTPNGYYSSQHDVESHADLPKLIGKENAANLLAQPPTPSPDKGEDRYTHTLQGPLQVGGHGMVDYYKNYVNQGAMKLLQQHDQSAKPESYDLPEGYKGFALPVTDTSRESILKNGFQAFQRGGEVRKAAGGQVMGYVPMATLPVSRLAVARAPQYQQQAPVARFSESLNSLMDTVEGFKKKPELEDVQQKADPSSGRDMLATASGQHAGYDPTGMSEAANAAYGKLVDAYGQPLIINSAYRDRKHNAEVGGADNSQHIDGNAIDVDVTGKPYDERVALANLAWDAGYRGIGFYDNSMHFDVGDPRGWGPSHSRDSIPEWAQPFTEERYGYSGGGSAMDDNNQDKGMENGTTPINFATRPQAGELPDAGGIRGGAGVLQAQNEAPLEGLPQKIVIPMTGQIIHAGADPRIRQVARDYMAQAGLPYSPPTKYARVDPKRAARIASDYTNMEDNPDDPLTKASYNAMIKETMDQYRAAKKSGLKIEFWNPRKQEDPYKASPRLATEDVRRNHHMWVFPTYSGYGSGEPISEDDAKKNPLLQLTGETWNGIPVTVNDVFRAIHDYYGHAKEGLGFRADGEENAWRAHASMFSPLARMAMTSETRGQNSWLNYGPHGEHNRKARTEDTIFAPQKIGVLSHLSHHEGAEDFIKPEEISLMASIRSRFGKKLGGAVDAALALTRRFTKDGKSAISALKPKGK